MNESEDLDNELEDLDPEPRKENLSIPQLFAVNELRKPLMVVSFGMLAQQFCGKSSWLVCRVRANEYTY